MKLSNIVDLNKVVTKILNQDLEKIKNNNIFELDDISFLQIKDAILTNDLNAILYIINQQINEQNNLGNIDAVIFLFHYLYRNIYLLKTVIDWEKYNKEEIEVVVSETGEMFLKSVAPFFDQQISFFANNYLNFIMDIKLKDDNKEHFQELDEYISSILKYEDFNVRITNVENLVMLLQDTEKLNKIILNIDDEDKDKFLSLSNEIKVDFQTINNLIVEIISRLKELKVN